MNRNRATVKLSSLLPNQYSLPPRGWNPTIVCDLCNTHCQVRHALVEIHRPNGIRCAGSGVKIVFDVATEDWELMLRQASHATDLRRSKRVMIKPEPAPATPVHRIAVAC
jgi:hypothetical protein